MSLQKIMYVTAVPFNLARFQPSAVKNISSVQSESNNENLVTVPCGKRKINVHENAKEYPNLRIIRKKQNIFKNKADAVAFREKARLKRELLEKQVLDLKLDKLRLLWENEQLKTRQSLLVEENSFLKKRLENPQFHSQDITSVDTLKHAEGMGASTDVHTFDDASRGNLQQSSGETSFNLSSIGNLPVSEQMCEISTTTGSSAANDVFVCSLTEDAMKSHAFQDRNNIAMTICHEEVVSSVEVESTDVQEVEPNNLLSHYEPWTSDGQTEKTSDAEVKKVTNAQSMETNSSELLNFLENWNFDGFKDETSNVEIDMVADVKALDSISDESFKFLDNWTFDSINDVISNVELGTIPIKKKEHLKESLNLLKPFTFDDLYQDFESDLGFYS